MFMLSASWYGKFTPNFEELNNDATDFDEMLYVTNQTLSRFFNGQQKKMTHSMMFVASQSALRQKLNFSLMYSFDTFKPLQFMSRKEGDRNMTLNVRGVYNISKTLSLTAGYMRMFGGSSDMYGPVRGGVFAEFKARF